MRTILDLGHIPAGMELFPAADTQQLQYIKKIIDECDYYLLIMGGRYGSIDSSGVSYTEREYDYAVETGKTILAFPHADLPSIPVKKSDISPERQERLSAFRQKVMNGRLVRQWNSRQELDGLVTKSLARAVADYPAVGWIRGNAAANEDVLQQLNNLRIENERITNENAMFRESIGPDITGFANGSELYGMRFTESYRFNSTSRKREVLISASWDEIFRAVAQNLDLARPSNLIGSYITSYLREDKCESRSLSLYESDRSVVKNQLVSLGLILTRVSQSTDGKYYEWMSLTSFGQRKLASMLAVMSTSMKGAN
jgi:Domain of unknown function (DUF4062)